MAVHVPTVTKSFIFCGESQVVAPAGHKTIAQTLLAAHWSEPSERQVCTTIKLPTAIGNPLYSCVLY